MKLFITPSIEDAPHGIRRVIEAMHKYLPEFGISIVNDESESDLVNCHAMSYIETKKPVVHSNHGLYWGDFEWPSGMLFANQHIIDIISRAQAVTAPSHWVGNALARGQLKKPHVIHHGIDTDEWTPPKQPGAYVLWNKARTDVVSDPQDMQKLAAILPDIPFVSTFGKETPNVRVVGSIPHDEMKPLVRGARVYLATARETFGIGTLEALACGVPVVGWNWGGQTEIIQHGFNGYLAEPGNYEQLAEFVRLAYDDQDMREQARKSAVEYWQWQPKIKQYADLFLETHKEFTRERPKISVIITAYNLGKYLDDCLKSVQGQTSDEWECLIVNDCSTDDTYLIAERWQREDDRFFHIKTPENLKLSGARNYGFSLLNGRYIIYLDADDMLAPTALETLSKALDENPGIHIAYGHLEVMDEDGSNRRRNDWPFEQFSWHGQMAHLNQLSYCAMMRREVMENSGGYRRRDWRAEDASFWCNVTSKGYRAVKVTQEPTLIYRFRSDSKGAQEGHKDGDWTSWYPWRLGATTAAEGIKLLNEGKGLKPSLVPFGAQGQAPTYCWPVWSHHDPVVSIVIPVGPNHAHWLVDALDSVQAQTFPFWEVIVVNDTGKPLEAQYAPWARIIDNGTHNIADSRNVGIWAARAPLVLFLDVDDLLIPAALDEMLGEYIVQDGAKYIYTDWYDVYEGEEPKIKKSKDYNRNLRGLHPISVLICRDWALDVGGFDNSIPAWEDWDFFIKLAVNGYCGHRLDKPLLVYRTFAGERREQSLRDKDIALPVLQERYEAYSKGDKQMAGCCGGGAAANILLQAKRAYARLEEREAEGVMIMSNGGLVRLEYMGRNQGATTFRMPGLSKTYRGGLDPIHKYVDAEPGDVQLLLNTGRWKRAKSPTGIDLSQAAVPQAPVFSQPPDEPKAEKLPEPVITKRALKDPGDMTVQEVKEYALGLGLTSLKQFRQMEEDGKNRKTAVSAIAVLIDDVERVG